VRCSAVPCAPARLLQLLLLWLLACEVLCSVLAQQLCLQGCEAMTVFARVGAHVSGVSSRFGWRLGSFLGVQFEGNAAHIVMLLHSRLVASMARYLVQEVSLNGGGASSTHQTLGVLDVVNTLPVAYIPYSW
jgi:hypothetical protein